MKRLPGSTVPDKNEKIIYNGIIDYLPHGILLRFKHKTFLSFPAITVLQMIVDKPCSLQMGVTNRSSEEFKSPFFHILTHGLGFGRGYRNFAQRPESVDNRFPVGKERQGVVIKTTEFLLYGKE